jgi:hypothetical protein
VTKNFPIQKPRLIVTAVCGPSLAKRPTSFVGLPIVKVPGGIQTRLVFGVQTAR